MEEGLSLSLSHTHNHADDAMVLCSSSSSITLPEYHSALCLLHHMDCHWFQDNILKPAPPTAALSFYSTAASLSASSATFPTQKTLEPSPFRSIEMVAVQSGSTVPLRTLFFPRTLPCSRFRALPVCTMPAVPSSLTKDEDPVDGGNSSTNQQLSVHLMSIQQNQQDGIVPFLCARGVSTKTPISQEASSAFDSCKEDTLSQVSSLQKELLVSCNPNSSQHVAIASGKPLVSGLGEPMPLTTRVARKSWQRSIRIATFLNYEERQVLDFHFSRFNLTPSMFNMFLPTATGEDEELGKCSTLPVHRPRPFQNEAWLTRKSQVPLLGWRISAPTGDMKEQLKFWARAVACTVRQEC